jgi:phosphoribosyl 1,2-cyclic phosphodiesterase
MAKHAGARRVVLFHHEPDRTDHDRDRLARRIADSHAEVTVGAEGAVLGP